MTASRQCRICIGTSGWQYRDWRGVLYPKGLAQAHWLERYAEVFDTVELNSSFYRLPPAASFGRWRAAVPPSFVVATKLSRYLTHVRRLRGPAAPVRLFLDRASHLGDRMGPVVVQLPPTLPQHAGNLRQTLQSFPSHIRVAVEFRHPSWFSEEIQAILHQHHAALVWADRNGRLLNPAWQTADWLYLRLHGGLGRDGNYGSHVIGRYAEQLTSRCAEAYVYFNNDRSGNAVRNALALRRRIAKLGHPVPADDAGRPVRPISIPR